MRDFTKFKLKSEAELTELVKGLNNIAVLACNKCFKALTDDAPEPELDVFLEFAASVGASVLSSERLDFLCNEYRLRQALSRLSSSVPSSFIVISCGVGAQTAAAVACDLLPGVAVYTACDSLASGGFHGMSLSDRLCRGCGQCFLNATGGLCPVTGCAKSLLNGPCGGAKGGKCEVDSDSDCVWDNARNTNGLLLFDHRGSILGDISELTSAAQKRRAESFYGGLYLKYRKDSTAFLTLRKIPFEPAQVVLPMSQHAGTSADPIVCVGDYVKVGQKIGEAVGVISSCIHSSVSGTVSDISLKRHPNVKGDVCCITIDSDHKNEPHNSIRPIPYWDDLDIFDIDAIVAEKGIVGMGGAGFPTPVKLKSPKPIDTILINGCESEPYITSDHRVMLERADDIINGLQIVMRSTGAKRAIIVISDNKSNAIAHLEEKTAVFDDIFVMALWSKYPQGAERMLIARTLGRHLEYGQRPYDVGAIVINVSTAAAIGDAFYRGMPLIERAVTVSGEKIKRPGNYIMPIGTLVSDILSHCGLDEHDACVKLGGPMMGVTIDDYNVPVIKGTNAIIATNKRILRSSDCIRCGRCVDVCPMELLPLYFPIFDKSGCNVNVPDGNLPSGVLSSGGAGKQAKNPMNCIECGACDYICPSFIEIRKAIRSCKEKVLC